MSTTLGVGRTPIVLKATQYVSLTMSSSALGTLAIPTQGVAQAVSGAGSFSFGGYANQVEVVLNLTAGSCIVIVSDTPPATVAAVTPVQLTGNYTLVPGDDGKIFQGQAGSALTVTVPTGLGWVTGAIFKPANTGSITLHPVTATINGASSDIAINITTNPIPAALVATNVTDNYGLTASSTFAGLSGAPTDNTALATALNGKAAVQAGGAQTVTNYTLAASDHDGVIWIKAQTTDKTITVPTGLPTNFRCFIGYLNVNAAVGRGKIVASGTTLNWESCDSVNAAYTQGVFQNNVGTIFMGKSSANSSAMGILTHEGAAPGETYIITPIKGTWTTV